jgi:hypothetical protein
LQNIAKYDEAIPTVKKYANVPNDWTVTIIDNKPTAIIVACAPPTYGPITPEKYNDLARHAASTLTVIPNSRAIPKAVMLTVTYVHLTPRRKERARVTVGGHSGIEETRWHPHSDRFTGRVQGVHYWGRDRDG